MLNPGDTHTLQAPDDLIPVVLEAVSHKVVSIRCWHDEVPIYDHEWPEIRDVIDEYFKQQKETTE